jgi:hypothetical protein
MDHFDYLSKDDVAAARFNRAMAAATRLVTAAIGTAFSFPPGCTVVDVGDFFTEVTASGDAFMLSRILHDWDDHNCLRILQAIRAASRPGSCLLIIERLIPESAADAAASLVYPWDIQMLACTGGRERSLREYAGLLAEAGFEADEVTDLPVDMKLLVARPAI